MVGLLMITHNRIGDALLDTAIHTLGICPIRVKVLAVMPDCDPAILLDEARGLVSQLDQGDGVLVLTDMYGSTPSNIANHLADGERVMVITGINLPMLIRVVNYPTLSLLDLARKAESGGLEGIFICSSTSEV